MEEICKFTENQLHKTKNTMDIIETLINDIVDNWDTYNDVKEMIEAICKENNYEWYTGKNG